MGGQGRGAQGPFSSVVIPQTLAPSAEMIRAPRCCSSDIRVRVLPLGKQWHQILHSGSRPKVQLPGGLQPLVAKRSVRRDRLCDYV
jgi:hypothetical protein